MITMNVAALYDEEARLADEDVYIESAKALAGRGQDVTLTGSAPGWLYLIVVHALHGVVRNLWYDSPVAGPVLIFSHDPSDTE